MDAQMGVGHFEDFPFGSGFPPYGGSGDRPCEHLQDITDDVGLVQTALNGLSTADGADNPESHVEALYQTATGLGGNWSSGGEQHLYPTADVPVDPR